MPTTIPLRLQIQRAISEVLLEVNPDNGYEFDLRPAEDQQPRIVRGRLTIGDDEPLPMVTILEPPLHPVPTDTMRQPDNTARQTEWDLIIQGFAMDDPVNPTDIAYQLEAEVRRCLAMQKKRRDGGVGSIRHLNILGLGDKIQGMTFSNPVIRPSETVANQAMFYFVLTLKFCEDMESAIG